MTAAALPEVTLFAHIYDGSDMSHVAPKILDIWIKARALAVAGDSSQVAREYIIDELIKLFDWRGQFIDAYQETGRKPFTKVFERAYAEYVDEHRDAVFNCIPSHLYTEFRWIPGAQSTDTLDTIQDTHGIQSTKFRSTYLEDVVPGPWLTRFLKLVNVSYESVVEEAKKRYKDEEEGLLFAQKVAESGESFEVALAKPLMTPYEVLGAIENAYSSAVPVVHAEINLRALLELDIKKPICLSTDKRGEVHIGFHCFMNGAGYLDTYPGQIVIDPSETGFTSLSRWTYGINQVYGLAKSYFYCTPYNV